MSRDVRNVNWNEDLAWSRFHSLFDSTLDFPLEKVKDRVVRCDGSPDPMELDE